MNWLVKIVVLFVALGVGNVIYKITLTKPVTPPADTWWGPKSLKEDTTIRSFKINVPNEVLEDLQYRLKNARPLTPPLEGIQHQYGINTNLLKEIVDFWLTKYDWKQREKFLNQFPQFKTNIQGLEIHYIHVKPKEVPSGVRVLPLLLLHGWPGSIREFYETIPLLTTIQKDKNFVFEVIAPSLPGYGFSQGAVKPGLGAAQIAVVFKNLMKRVGFDQFYIQGGDWGAVIATDMAIFYPDLIKGLHLNMCYSNRMISGLKLILSSLWPGLIVNKVNQHKLYPLTNLFSTLSQELGYMHIQATKPDTVGVGLTDSPVALAACILEKFIVGTNLDWVAKPDGGLTQKFTYTKLLDNIMIYWITNSITTSVRLYAETLNTEQFLLVDEAPVLVPTVCAVFDKELFYQPEIIHRDKYKKLLKTSELSGGHFAAFEVPEILAKDVWTAIAKFENKI